MEGTMVYIFKLHKNYAICSSDSKEIKYIASDFTQQFCIRHLL